MRSASTERISSASELSKIAQEKAIQGQPTLAARVQAEPTSSARVQAKPILSERSSDFPRVMARPILGQAPAARPVLGQTPVEPASSVPSTVIGQGEARLILNGLTETLRLADDARTTGWRCGGVDDATFYKGRVLRSRLAEFVAAPPAEGVGFTITKEEADVAEKILGCSNEATASSPNKAAWIALGVIVAGAAIFFSLSK